MWCSQMREDDLPPTSRSAADEGGIGFGLGKAFVSLLWLIAFAALIAFGFLLAGARFY